MKIKLEGKNTILSESKVYRLMKKYGLMSNALYTKKNKIIVKAIHSYTNQLKGDFSADLPNIKWCIDMSKIKTDEGAVYICALIDLYDRLIVNYKIFNAQNTRLVKSTIDEALKKHNIDQETPILLQSDHGSQFTNNQYYNFTKKNNIQPSMASKGTPTENAVIESFFATLKVECVYKYKFRTKEEAILTIKEFIDYYNNGRIQLKTGLTPMEIRDSFYNKQVA
jgi:putative transposase